MLNKIRGITNKRYFHIAVLIILLAVILFIVGIIILRYSVEGETNMPFELSKISVISSGEGIDKEAVDTKWAFDIYQSNDIFLYIDKNDNYGKTEIIKSVTLNNIQIESNKKDNIKIYKPDSEQEKLIFKNSESNIVDSLEYTGDMESDLKNMKISNQGGIIAFRCSLDNLAEYKSDDEEINHQELLKKAGLTNEDLKTELTFDLNLNLQSGKEYKTTINLELPIGNVVEEGTTSQEITDLSKFIFKRIKN